MKQGDLVTWFDERVGPRFGYVVEVMGSAALVTRAGVTHRLNIVDLRSLRDGPRPDQSQGVLEHMPVPGGRSR